MYDYGYDYSTAVDAATGVVGIMGGLTLGIFIFSSIIGLIAIISYAKIFTKAGKPWWASIIPIYNTIVMIEIAKLPLWYIALFFVPIANIYAIFKINIEIAKKFGKEVGFGIGMTLLSIIFIPLLAFSDNKYEDDNAVLETVNNEFNADDVINNSSSADNTIVAPIGTVTLENNPFAPAVEPVESIPVESAPAIEPVESISVEPVPAIEPVENIPVEPVPAIEPVESISVEPVPVAQPQVNAFNMAPETNIEPLVTETINEPLIPEQLNVNSNEFNLASNVAEDKKVCKNCGNELPDIVSICPNCGTDNE